MSQDPLSRDLYAKQPKEKKTFVDYLLWGALIILILTILIAGGYYEWIKFKFFLHNQ